MMMLTVTQPWASLIACGAKRIETRSWQTHYRGPVAIHAAKTLNGIFRGATEADLAELCCRWPFDRALDDAGIAASQHLSRGCIIAVADLADVVSTTDPDAALPIARGDHHGGDRAAVERELHFGDYSPGRFAWLLDDVRPLTTPVELRGERGLQRLQPDVAAQVARAIR